MAKAKDYFLDWVNNVDGEGGGHRTYFVDEGNNWGGDTAQNLKKRQVLKLHWVVKMSMTMPACTLLHAGIFTLACSLFQVEFCF